MRWSRRGRETYVPGEVQVVPVMAAELTVSLARSLRVVGMASVEIAAARRVMIKNEACMLLVLVKLLVDSKERLA